jgi:colicin import membrane protein
LKRANEKGWGLMARKLKTYETSLGFFDLAVAAPSMKAALEAWGSKRNLFNKGFAKITDDPAIVAATMAKPGVVLKRALGSTGQFSEHAELPKVPPVEEDGDKPKSREMTAKEKSPRDLDNKADSDEQKRCESERMEEAEREKGRARRERAITKAEAALGRAKEDHDRRTKELESKRAALDRQSEAEEARWKKQKEQLQANVLRARE